MLRTLARPVLLALALAAFAACGQAAPGSGAPAPTGVGVASPTSGPAAADAAPTNAGGAPTTVVVATVAAPSPQASPAASGPFAGIEQGTTPEGYHTLGSASAPVTLVMYSDFL